MCRKCLQGWVTMLMLKRLLNVAAHYLKRFWHSSSLENTPRTVFSAAAVHMRDVTEYWHLWCVFPHDTNEKNSKHNNGSLWALSGIYQARNEKKMNTTFPCTWFSFKTRRKNAVKISLMLCAPQDDFSGERKKETSKANWKEAFVMMKKCTSWMTTVNG